MSIQARDGLDPSSAVALVSQAAKARLLRYAPLASDDSQVRLVLSSRTSHGVVAEQVARKQKPRDQSMSRVTAPLLSFSGSGQIAKTQVYAEWKGIPYVRRYVIPANPRSSGQTLTRNVFSWLNYVWRVAPADFVAPWQAAVQGRQMIDRNLWIKQNLSLLREAISLEGMVFSPGAKGGISSPITITPGAGQLTFAGADPTPLPAGWTVVKLVGAAILEQDPQTDTDYTVHVASDATTAYSVVMTGLEATTDYAAAAWWVYQRSASPTDLAYSAAIATVVTTS